jgi:RNA recognition motif-containing protein
MSEPSTKEGRKIFIGGIPFGVDQMQVKDDFLMYGEIEDVYLPTDRATGKIRGFAFVTFRESRHAHAAAGAMHGRDYHGRQISVNIAKPRERESQTAAPSRPRDYDRGLDERWRRDDERGTGDASERERERDETDRFIPRYTHGNSYDGSGRYGDKDPRPPRTYYD